VYLYINYARTGVILALTYQNGTKTDNEELIEEVPIEVNQIKSFSCTLCSILFSKFEAYREHIVSTERRYK
jgi:hypothetical protein